MRFLAPKNNEKTKFGRPVIGVWAQAPGALRASGASPLECKILQSSVFLTFLITLTMGTDGTAFQQLFNYENGVTTRSPRNDPPGRPSPKANDANLSP